MTRTKQSMLRTIAIVALAGVAHLITGASSASAQYNYVLPDKYIYKIPDAFTNANPGNGPIVGTPASVDLRLNVTGGGTIDVTGWAAILEMNTLGLTGGDVTFVDIPFNNEIEDTPPNLPAAVTSPFGDFDKDYPGMAYGGRPQEGNAYLLTGLSIYIAPEVNTPAPATDANGNITVPNDAGLVSVPVFLHQGAQGSAIVQYQSDPEGAFNGLTYAFGPGQEDVGGLATTETHETGTLTIIETLQGDANLDGIVDIADFTTWLNNFGQSVSWQGGNFDSVGDGTADIADFTLWLNNFGQTVMPVGPPPSGSPAASPAAVPEPSTAMLLLAAIPAALVARRRRRNA